jgi:hypothetical protein
MNYSSWMTIADNEALMPLDAEQEIEFKSALLPAIQCCYAISGLSPNSLFPLYLRGSRFAIWTLESALRSAYERIMLRTALDCAVAKGTSSVMWLSLSGGQAGGA